MPDPNRESDLDRVLAECKANQVNTLLLGLTDIDGVIRGKYLDLGKLEQLVNSEGGFCNVVFGWDIDDHVYELDVVGVDTNASFTGWHTGYPDAKFRLIESTQRTLPDTKVPFFIGEFVDESLDFHPLCPRSVLRRVAESLHDRGTHAFGGFEYEFFVLDDPEKTVRENGFEVLRSLTKGNLGYSVVKAATHSSQLTELMDFCREFRMTLEGLHFEARPGTWEAALAKQEVIEAADRANLFKTFSKSYFRQHDAVASFMAKWSMKFPGQSGHFHLSLCDEKGTDLFQSEDRKLNDAARFAMGGLVKYLPQWLPMLAPNVNSFTRLVKGAWAPIAANWGFENRTCALRVIQGKDSSCHIENRIPGADSNPYLVAAATLAAAKLGIEQRIEPPEPVVGNGYEADNEPEAEFSTTLREAALRLKQSEEADLAFGSKFIEHFVNSRLWESREAQRTVNDWQLQRYFEVI